MDETRLRPRKSRSFQVIRCEVCGAEVVIDKARDAQCPKCGAGRENPMGALPPVPAAEAQPKVSNPLEGVPVVPAAGAEEPEKMPSRRIQSWRSSLSDVGRPTARHGNRPFTESRGPRPVEREPNTESRPRSERAPERKPERGYERGFDRAPDRPTSRGSERGPNRSGERPFHRGADHGSSRGAPRNRGPRYGGRPEHRSAAPEVPAEVKREVLAAWVALRQQDERPPEGRRMKLATQFGLTFDQVTAVIKEQPREREAKPAARPKPVDLLENMDPAARRSLGFQIEKAYFAELETIEGKRPWKIVVKAVARRVQKPEGLVANWLQILHRKSKRMIRAQRLDEAAIQRIVEAYQEYLRNDSPPEMALHKTLATLTGVKQRQVHRVLFEYRWRLRNQAIAGPPLILESEES